MSESRAFIASNAVQAALTNTILGLLCGTTIDYVMPPYSADVAPSTLVAETMLQAALNGVAIAIVADAQKNQRDPCAGMPFAYALYESQSGFHDRALALGRLVKGRLREVAPRMAPLVPKLASPGPNDHTS